MDAETEQILGVKCRLCDEVILDEKEANEILAVGMIARPANVHPVFTGLSLLSFYLLMNGGIHMVTCKAGKTN